MKLVEDVTGEEVSEMHARSVLVEILDPVTCQHTAMNHSKSYEALKKIVQEFANDSTTSHKAMQIGRVEAGATAPTTAWPPLVAETSEDSWEEYDAINAMGSQQCWTCKGYDHVSRDCPNGKGKGKGKDNFGKGNGAHEWCKSNYNGNKGSNYGMYKGGVNSTQIQHEQSCTAWSHFITRTRVAQELQSSGLHILVSLKQLSSTCHVSFLAAPDTDHKHKFSLTHFIRFSYLSHGLTFTNKPYDSQPIHTMRCSTAEWRINTNPISYRL